MIILLEKKTETMETIRPHKNPKQQASTELKAGQDVPCLWSEAIITSQDKSFGLITFIWKVLFPVEFFLHLSHRGPLKKTVLVKVPKYIHNALTI